MESRNCLNGREKLIGVEGRTLRRKRAAEGQGKVCQEEDIGDGGNE